METQKTNTTNKNSIPWGAIMLIIAGLVVIFLLALGSWTDNRFGTHMVLDIDLTSGPIWYLCLIATVGSLISITGIILIVLNAIGVYELDSTKDRTLMIGSFLLMGTSAFVLALSSISFAAFNWQFFDSQFEHGTAIAAQAMMGLTIVFITASLAYTVFGMVVPLNQADKMYYGMRNTSIGLIALGWFVFNVCINSFGAMGGDANVLVDGLFGKTDVLLNLGNTLNAMDGSTLAEWATMTGKNSKDAFVYMIDNTPIGLIINNKIPGTGESLWILGGTVQLPKWWNDIWTIGIAESPKLSPLPNVSLPFSLQQIIESASTSGIAQLIAKEVVELSTGKEGMIMGVNNSVNSFMIFMSLLLAGFVGLPLYAKLTYKTQGEKPSIMFWGSIIVIISMTVIYLFMLLTPYMVSSEGAPGLLGMLLDGQIGNSLAPGLVAFPGHDGGIHSAIVYFSDEYNGTPLWWIVEGITFVVPVASFVGTWLFLRKNNK